MILLIEQIIQIYISSQTKAPANLRVSGANKHYNSNTQQRFLDLG